MDNQKPNLEDLGDVVSLEELLEPNPPEPQTLTIATLNLDKYEALFKSCNIRPEQRKSVQSIAERIVKNKSRYEAVSKKLPSIPWYFIAVVHQMESSGSFSKHLHNGDPLTKRTTHVPAGRPLGNPPFTWEESAVDALKLMKLDKWTDWSIGGLLYKLELYNGMGYSKKGLNSPYLWSFSNHYNKGKYVADGKYDANAISKQCGAATILHYMQYEKLIELKK